ncbi:MAG: septal ring lytic transglycosylase RlpA family protein [Crinalium sp.]
MNQRFWISLPAALLATLGTTFSSYAQPQTAFDSHSEALTQTEISEKTQKVELGSSESDLNKGYGKRKRSSGSGMASWYGAGPGYTAAHRTLPFGTRVRVTNLNNNRSVVVKINDRGPFIAGRVIDVSGAAASVLGIRSSGVAPVSIQVLGS